MAALFSGGLSLQAATVATDKSDYQPGDKVTLNGEGWQPGEQVSVRITEINPALPQTPKVWRIIADNQGAIEDSSYAILQRHLGVSFTLQAVGETSGETARTDFTDGPPGSPPPSGVSPANPPIGGFGIDGDLMANTPTADVGDWLAGPGGIGGSVMDITGTPINPIATIHRVDPYNDSSADMIFGGGEKWFDDPNNWNWSHGKSSSKTDINNVLFHIAPDSEGHIWGTVAADRYSTSGDSYIDFEFLQNTLTRNENNTFTSEGPNGGRTVNDLLLSLAFTGGGKVADFYVWSWQPDGKGGYTYVDMTDSIPDGKVLAALNEGTIDVPFGAFGRTQYDRYAFAEGTVDITALLNMFDPCMSLVVKTLMIKTKASQSSNASIEDMIDPIQVRLTIGPSSDAGADQIACYEGDSTSFPLAGNASQGLFPVASTEWTVVEGSATIDDPTALNTTAHVTSGTAVIRLTVIQQNGCDAFDDVSLTVKALPACEIAGAVSTLCPGALELYSAPEGMDSYAWSISGNATIVGAVDGRTVMVQAGEACAAPFTLSLTSTKEDCLNSCMLDVLVEDTTAPMIVCPADITIECDQSVAPDNTGIATATDVCDSDPSVSFSDTTLPGNCPQASIIERTWTAMDACGNESTCVQIINVVDTTAPMIVCPADVTIECDQSSAPTDTGMASATDHCDASVTITFTDQILPGDCAEASIIKRTWMAVDDCGNSSMCVQTINVVDTTAPSITCPPDAIIECDGSSEPAMTGIATASDNCDATPVVTYTDNVIPGDNAQESVIERTWKATDACGNEVTCMQTISVVDTSRPTINIPSNATVECDSDHSPAATGMASASDNCDPAPAIDWSDSIDAGECAGTMVITRTWTATDASGNSVLEVQTIDVVDTTAPMITCPADTVVECDAPNDPSATGMATATDNCDPNVTITYSDTILPGDCPQEKTIVRTWTAADCLGNSASCEQRITIQDTTAPSISAPTGVTLECPANTSPQATGWATGSDNCGDVTVSYSDDVEILCGASRIITRTWTVKDECGNETSDVQVIRVEDNTPPVLTCVVATTYSQGGYGGNGTPAEILMANYFTVFPDGITVGIYDDSNGNQAPNGLHWESTDAGLTTLRNFISQGGGTSRAIEEDVINADDGNKRGELAAQTLTLTINMRFNELGVIGIGPNNFADLVYTRDNDSLSGMTVREILEAANLALAGLGLPDGYSYARMTKITDLLNHAFHSGTHSDWAQAYLEVPAIIVQCASEIPTPDASRIKASDACGGKVTIAHEGDVISDQTCPGSYIIIRTWVATDECGNTGTCTQKIIVNDTTAPILTGETDRMVPGDEPWEFIEPLAMDNCDNIVDLMILNTTTNVLGDNALVATRTWQALDPCGNSAEFTQIVTVGNAMAVQSTFAHDNDNWTLLSFTDVQDPTHMGSGGQSGGYITTQSGGSDSIWYWTAPDSYLGDRSDYYGGMLTFSMICANGNDSAIPPAVIIISGNLTLIATFDMMPGTDWTPYSVVLSESANWVDMNTGENVTQEEMIHVMSNLEHLFIQVDFGDPNATGGLDDVAMVPPASLAAMTWTIQVQPPADGGIRLIWPAMDTSYQVEESDSLTAPNWRVLEVSPEEVGGYFRYEYKPESSPKFYRLRKP